MATTQNTYTGNGSTTNYSFTFEYIKQSDVKVTLDSVATTAFTFANATTLSFTSAPASGKAIRIYRDTDITNLNATFFPGSAIKAEDLNNNFTQTHFATQETDNEVVTANTTADTAKTTADSAVTTANSAVTTANAATATANTADTNASAAVTTANTASATATTASTNASNAVTTANTASTNASAAVTTANSAATDAATAITTANGAVTTANAATTASTNAQTDATSAVSTANTASTNASSAVTTANAASSTATTASTNASAAVVTANAASATVANAVLFSLVANVAGIPGSPSNNDYIEIGNSTGIESFSPLSGLPSGFTGASGLTVRVRYDSSASSWVFMNYFANDSESRYATINAPTFTGNLTIPDKIIHSGDTNTSIRFPAADTFTVETANVERLRIDSSGRVGIGTTAPFIPIQLNSYGGLDGNDNQLIISNNTYYSSGDKATKAGFSTRIDLTNQDGSIRFINTAASSSANAAIALQERLRIDSSGRVGIGTSAPIKLLHLSTSSDNEGIVLQKSSIGGAAGARISFQQNNTASTSTEIAAIKSDQVNATAGTEAGGLTLYTKAGTDGSAQARLKITETGAVGIGTTSPGAKLEVVGTIYGTSNLGIRTSSPQSNIHCNQDDSDSSLIQFTNTTTGATASDGMVVGIDNSEQGVINVKENKPLTISTNNTERARIDSSGNVGIGTTSPATNLEVVAAADGSDAALISLRNAGGTNSSATLRFVNSTSSLGAAKAEITAIRNASAGTDLVFKRQSNLESFRIDSSGRVGIGTTSPDTKLDVNGNVQFGDGGGFDMNVNGTRHQFSIGGSEKMRIDSSGRVGIGTTSPGAKLHVVTSGAGSIRFADGTRAAELGSTGTVCYAGSITSGQDFALYSANTERMRIDSAGNVGIGTTGPGAKLEVGGSAAFRTDADVRLTIGSSGSIGSNNSNFIRAATDQVIYNAATSSGRHSWEIAGSEKVRIDSSGNVGIGTTSPGDYLANAHQLVIADSAASTGITIATPTSSAGTIAFADGTGAAANARGVVQYSHSSNSMKFMTNAADAVLIDSSGRLLVGTSSAAATGAGDILQVVPLDTGGSIVLGRNDSSVVDGNAIGVISFVGNDGGSYEQCARILAQADGDHASGDKPSRLVFSTTADGASSPTEALRISNRRTSCFFGDTGHTIKSVVQSTTNRGIISGEYVFQGGHSGAAGSIGTVTFQVGTNGNVQNTNNSYGAISDIKLKENIVDASSQWDDLKALQVRNYNFIEGQTHTQIGVVAQEVELVSPGLVSESPDLDEEGTDLGTVTKSVNYSVLYMKAVKALQEAMERIETLEQRLSDAGIA